MEPARVEGGPVFGCFGHLNESKRVPQLLRAFARFRESRPEASLLLRAVGQGGDAPKMPPRGKLADSQIADLTTWIRLGALWPDRAGSSTKA